ncbi:hypothetical protein Vi05172_g9851 [Venturia inaequalis]|nr:hypothetical protein Vi05172_g9851 [Venturia inaequalis]
MIDWGRNNQSLFGCSELIHGGTKHAGGKEWNSQLRNVPHAFEPMFPQITDATVNLSGTVPAYAPFVLFV